MAALRAPTIASKIQPALSARGSPLAARNAPMNAKGRAKIVCSIFIISRVILSFLNTRIVGAGKAAN